MVKGEKGKKIKRTTIEKEKGKGWKGKKDGRDRGERLEE